MLNIFGLILSTFGAVLFAFYGPPPSRAVSKDGTTYAPLMELPTDDPEYKTIIENNKMEYKIAKRRSKIAFGSILAGFTLQLVSAAMDYWPKIVSFCECVARLSG